jgi:hypothetical protein
MKSACLAPAMHVERISYAFENTWKYSRYRSHIYLYSKENMNQKGIKPWAKKKPLPGKGERQAFGVMYPSFAPCALGIRCSFTKDGCNNTTKFH